MKWLMPVSQRGICIRITNGDPVIFLVDVRPQEEFDNYSIPRAISIPLKDLPPDNWTAYLNSDGRDIVFYSNDNVLSNKAWILCKQQGYENLYVLDGGINRWIGTILEPEIPDETSSTAEFDLFAFRKEASIHFTSGVTAAGSKSDPSRKK